MTPLKKWVQNKLKTLPKALPTAAMMAPSLPPPQVSHLLAEDRTGWSSSDGQCEILVWNWLFSRALSFTSREDLEDQGQS